MSNEKIQDKKVKFKEEIKLLKNKKGKLNKNCA